MGCINSTKKLHTAKGGNFYKVSLVGLQPDLPSMPRCGILELRPLELVFTATGRDPFKWALQHLRRYGLNGNIFSFETGRRCIMGPRIYMFRCCNADILYQKFQRYINSITAERNRHGQVMEAFEAVARNEYNTKANHYLHSVTASQAYGNSQHHQNETLAIMGQTEKTPSNNACENKPISVISKREVYQSESPIHEYTNIALSKDELTIRDESNNNINCTEIKDTKKDINMMYSFKSNTDTPISPIINIHFYGHINEFTPIFVNEFPLEEEYSTPKHFYENLIIDKTMQQPEQCNNNSSASDLPSTTNPSINYIVLDLHKSSESTETAPTSSYADRISSAKDEIDVIGLQGTLPTSGLLSTTKSYSELSEVSRGYSSIDFVKTYALNKSSGNFIECDVDRDTEEFRVTRHSKSLIYNNKSNSSIK